MDSKDLDAIERRAFDQQVRAMKKHYEQTGREKSGDAVVREVQKIAEKVYRERSAEIYKDKS